MKVTNKAILNGTTVATRKSAKAYSFCVIVTGYINVELAASEAESKALMFETGYEGWDTEVKAENVIKYRALAAKIRAGETTHGALGWSSTSAGAERLMADARKMNLKAVTVTPTHE